MARRIGERRGDRVLAVEDDGVARLSAPPVTPCVLIATMIALPRLRPGLPFTFRHIRFCHIGHGYCN